MFKNLRIHIFLNLAVLLLLAMMLIDFVFIIVSQETLIGKEIERAEVLIKTVESHFQAGSDGKGIQEYRADTAVFDRLMAFSECTAALVVDHLEQPVYAFSLDTASFKVQVEDRVRLAIQKGVKSIAFFGSVRGIFWNQKEVVVLALPLVLNGKISGAAAVAMPLIGVYEILRRTQHIVLIYAVINTLILALFGLYRMHLLTVKPIRRLVSRAESFRETADDFFLIEKEDSEFSQLSKSLNRMLMRISESREELKASVLNLEAANRQLEATQKDLIQTEKLASVGRLSAGIAHEIGNPIGIIRGYLDLLQDPNISEEERRDYIGRTQSEIDRINFIIRQLLDLSRPLRSRDERISVHGIIREIYDLMRYQPMFSSVELDLDLTASDDRVMADGNQLRQVFLNLMINATDAMAAEETDEGHRLTVRTRLIQPERGVDGEDRILRVAFTDNGPGVPESHLTNIFDPFFTTKEPGKGTGLGLSVSYMLVESMGGTIRAENQAEGGLSMIIDLPIAEDVHGTDPEP